MTTRKQSPKKQMSKYEADYHEVAAGSQARADANREGVDDRIAEDALLSATVPTQTVRGKVLRHPSRGATLRKYRAQEMFLAWAEREGIKDGSLRYEEVLSMIFLISFWEPHYFDKAIDGLEPFEDVVARLEDINDDPDWTQDLIVISDHMAKCLQYIGLTARNVASDEEAKKKP